MITSPRRRAARVALAFALVSVTLLILPLAASAHAELDTTDPAEGEVVAGTPEVIVADFTESLAAGSRLRLRDAAGALVTEGAIDPANDRRMVIEPPELAPGTYEVVWQARAEDGHIERGRYSFTVESAAPTPQPTPPPTAAGSGSPSPASAAPTTAPATASPAPSPDEEPASGTSDILLPILVVMAMVVIGGALLLGRRRTSA